MAYMALANVPSETATANRFMTSLPDTVDQNPSTQSPDAMYTPEMRRNALACNLSIASPRVTIADPFAICCRVARVRDLCYGLMDRCFSQRRSRFTALIDVSTMITIKLYHKAY